MIYQKFLFDFRIETFDLKRIKRYPPSSCCPYCSYFLWCSYLFHWCLFP